MIERRQTVEELEAAIAKARRIVEKYSLASGYRLNPDADVVATVVEGLARNRLRYGLGYCPCVLVSGNREQDRAIICPCTAHKEDIARDGMCHCALYVSADYTAE